MSHDRSISLSVVAASALCVAALCVDVASGSTFAVDDWAEVFGSDGRRLANTGDDHGIAARALAAPSLETRQWRGDSVSGEVAMGESFDALAVCLRFDRAHLRPFVAGGCVPQCLPCPEAWLEPCPCGPPIACSPCPVVCSPPQEVASAPANMGGAISLLSSPAGYSTNWLASTGASPKGTGAVFGDVGYGGGGGIGGGFPGGGGPGGGPGSGPGGGGIDPGPGGPGGGPRDPGGGGPGDGPGAPGGEGEGEGDDPSNPIAPEPASLVAWGLACSVVLLRRVFGRRRC